MTFVLQLFHGKDQQALRSHLLDLIQTIPAEEQLLSTSRHDLSDKLQHPAACRALRTPPLPFGPAPTRWVVLENIETLKDAAAVNQLDEALLKQVRVTHALRAVKDGLREPELLE